MATTAPQAVARTLRVGLTGGIASGKSTVSQLFAALGVAVIDADLVSREVVEPGSPLLTQVFDLFGAQLRRADGSLDRAALRQLVFTDMAKRQQLEALLHPAIQSRSEQLAARATGTYQIHVIPLLVETQAEGRYDRVLVVDCPEELQFARLLARDGTEPAQARAMLATQASRMARLAVADDVILNDGQSAALIPKVAALHQRYLTLAEAARAR